MIEKAYAIDIITIIILIAIPISLLLSNLDYQYVVKLNKYKQNKKIKKIFNDGDVKMTNKRFTVIDKTGIDGYSLDNLYDSGTYIGTISIGSEMIVYLLNSLNDENEQLKKEKQNLYRIESKLRVENKQLKEENEQLRQFFNMITNDLKSYKIILESCNKKELEEIFNNIRFDWKQFNKGDVE